MAEFQEVCKQWRRMCKAQDDTNCGACESCPMMDNGASCIAVYEDDYDKVDFAHIEQTVTAWAAEHPVVYPTWWEWLASIGAVTRKVKPDVASELIDTGLLDEIPTDMAQKLGIEPKEG